MTTNPLTDPPALPNGVPAFDHIREAHYLPAVKEGIARARARIEAVKVAEPSFQATIAGLETAGEDLDVIASVFFNQLSAVGGDALHALAEEVSPLLADFGSDVALDTDLFARVKAVWDGRQALSLTPEEATLLEDTYQGFARNGALLPEDKKTQLREIDAALSTLGPGFMHNVAKSAEAFTLHLTRDDEVAGLPESALDGARHAAQDKGLEGWLFTLDAPSCGPFLQFADRRDLRETMWRAFASRGWGGGTYDNGENIRKTVALRAERAALLGYATHADFVLERRMAGSVQAVWDFLDTLKAAYRPSAEQELDALRAASGLGADLMPWDVGYYAEKLRQERFAFSSEDLRPYFPLERVLSGVFAHFEKLFGLRFESTDRYPVWHKDVQAFDVYDAQGFVGTLYGDFYPRTGKKDGAWKTTYRNQGLHHGRVERPVVAIVANVTKPTADRPSLLTHREVEILLHEMGHATHALLSRVRYRSLAGTSVKWDFVELPSQLQENWAYERETLDALSGHYQTGEKIPDALIDKLRSARRFMVGTAGLRQVALATLDMAWHTGPGDVMDITAFEDAAVADCTLFPRLAGPFSAAFSHIFAGGYSAGYYSYKWAEVLDADAFGAFLEAGLYDRDTAARFVSEVLSKGGSERPEVLFHNFRGRDADPAALLRREGLAA
ncbi:MAG TPA: peptidase M3 [Rhodospirillaceae bacterium]|jgi:peptidyl-dipeptidase Dcp|nr:M3 family metallopeptidase [Alphaproteobacteria bacterium]HBH26779.1 peptidase M3 [Rhodospirillaceae bacterium]